MCSRPSCKQWLLLLGLSLVLLAASRSSHAQAATRFEIRAASLTASADWQAAKLRGEDDPLYVAPEVLLDNASVAQADAKKELGGQVFVIIQLTPAGAAQLELASRVLLRQRMAVMINGEVLMAPVVSAPLTSNRFAISGFVSLEEAQSVAQGILGKS